MADRQDMERRRRNWDREEKLRRERRGPQGFSQENWGQSRRSMRPVQNPLDEQDDYRMRHREQWDDEGEFTWESERDRWMDYGRDYGTSQDWQQRGEGLRGERQRQERYGPRDFQSRVDERPERQWGSRSRHGRGWDDYEMDYGRGDYDQRRTWSERGRRDWDEDRQQRGRGDFDPYGRRQDRGYGDIRGRGFGWEGGHMDPYNRGFFRREEAAHPDYLERYGETHFGDEWDTGEDIEGDVAYTYTEFWLVPGPFSGVGPKGYQRSDDRIFEDVCYRMSTNGQLDPSEIDVKVENGEVTLEGKVQDRKSKRLAEDIAESVSGVSEVHNRIRVGEKEGQKQPGTRENAQQQTSGSRQGMDE